MNVRKLTLAATAFKMWVVAEAMQVRTPVMDPLSTFRAANRISANSCSAHSTRVPSTFLHWHLRKFADENFSLIDIYPHAFGLEVEFPALEARTKVFNRVGGDDKVVCIKDLTKTVLAKVPTDGLHYNVEQERT